MDTNKLVWPRYYVSAPTIPAWWKRELDRIGGYNHMAKPNLRLIWGMDERIFENDNPKAMKYANPNDTELGWACFILERYAATGFFNEDQWNALRCGKDEDTGKQVDYLGPYKREGDYLKVGEMMDNDFAPLPNETIFSQQMLDDIKKRVVEGAQKNKVLGIYALQRKRSLAEKKAKLEDMQAERREYYRMNAEKINAVHSREYSGLGSPIPSTDALKRVGNLLIPKGLDLCQQQ